MAGGGSDVFQQKCTKAPKTLKCVSIFEGRISEKMDEKEATDNLGAVFFQNKGLNH